MSDHDLTEQSLLNCVYNEGLSAAQWEEIGARLGLPTSVLKEIEYTYPRSPDRCLLEVVSRWSKSNSTVSKEKFLQALKVFKWQACRGKSTPSLSCIAFMACLAIAAISAGIIAYYLPHEDTWGSLPAYQAQQCMHEDTRGSSPAYQAQQCMHEDTRGSSPAYQAQQCMHEDTRGSSPANGYTWNLKALYQSQPEVPGIEFLWYDKYAIKFISPVFHKFDPRQSSTDYQNATNELHFDDFFKFSGTVGQRILIQGKPGTGKTTLAHHLTQEWANGTGRISECPLLVKVTMRELRMGSSGHLNMASLLYA